jgi:putative transposase
VQQIRSAVDHADVTPPRQIEKGKLCFVTVRAVNRSFRFVPKRRVRETLWYCLAVALEKFADRVAVHEFLFMSNHFHLTLTDTKGCLPDLMEYLDSLLARALNALHGTTGTVIEKGYNLVDADPETLLEHCAYTLTNPCESHLVTRARHWKSASSLQLEYGVPVTIKRPKSGLWAGKLAHANRKSSQRSKRAEYAGRSKLPKEATFALQRPPVMLHLGDAELRAHVRQRVETKELEFIAERKAKGIRVMGWDKVVEQHFSTIPGPEERFGRVPSFSRSTHEARVAAAQRRRTFLSAYYEALKKYVRGVLDVAFPEGTWFMKKRFGVSCCPLPGS